jgi:Leucine-rich repeat (LRR) protein
MVFLAGTMHGDLEMIVVRPDNPLRYGSRAVTSFPVHVAPDPFNDIRLVDNPRTRRDKLEFMMHDLNRPSRDISPPYVTPFLLRDVIVDEFLQRDDDEVLDTFDEMRKGIGKKYPEDELPLLTDLFLSISKKKSRATGNFKAVKDAITLLSFPLPPGIDYRDLEGKESWMLSPASGDLLRPYIDFLDDRYFQEEYNELSSSYICGKLAVEKETTGKGREMIISWGRKYIPRCISDGRFKNLSSITIHGDNFGKLTKVENIDRDGLPVLESVDLSRNEISDTRGFGDQSKFMKEITLSNNKIDNIRRMEKFEILERFNASNVKPWGPGIPRNEIRDITPLSKIRSIKNISLHDNKVKSFPDFSGTALQSIDLSRNEMKRPPPVENVPVETIMTVSLFGNLLDLDECIEFSREMRKKKGDWVNVECEPSMYAG